MKPRPDPGRVCTLAGVVLAAMPLSVAAKPAPHSDANRNSTYSLAVNAQCTLSLSTTGTVVFPPVSGLGSSGQESTPNNPATTECAAASAKLNIYDGSLLGALNYELTSGTNKTEIHICQDPRANQATCYTNSNDPQLGFAVGNGSQAFNIYGRLKAQGVNAPGTYTDVVTVALTFS